MNYHYYQPINLYMYEDFFKAFPSWALLRWVPPRDEKLYLDLLQKKIESINVDGAKFYDYTPEELAGILGAVDTCTKPEWVHKKYQNGKRPKRASEDGYWKATGVARKNYRNPRHV